MAKLLRLLCRYFCVEGIIRRTAVAFTMQQPEVLSQTLNSALRWSEEPWSATGKNLNITFGCGDTSVNTSLILKKATTKEQTKSWRRVPEGIYYFTPKENKHRWRGKRTENVNESETRSSFPVPQWSSSKLMNPVTQTPIKINRSRDRRKRRASRKLVRITLFQTPFIMSPR